MSVNSVPQQDDSHCNNVRKDWHAPWKLLERKSENHAVFVLNTPINFPKDVSPLILDIWNTAKVRVTVDGGTDRWLKWIESITLNTKVAHPDLITGDMDSISNETMEYFASRPQESRIIYTNDQNETDFTKALIELGTYVKTNALHVDNVLVLNDMSGRFDQVISNINSLHKAKHILPEMEVYLLSPVSLIWLLDSHLEHNICVPRILRKEMKTCALLPIGGKCNVTTSGLKWNLKNAILEFGNLVSSSNTYDANVNVVQIKCDNSLVWTMEIDSYLAQQSNNTIENNVIKPCT